MSIEIIDELMVCSDCSDYLSNGENSSLDFHYDEKQAEKRLAEIRESERSIIENGSRIVSGDSTKDDEFSTRSCDCCGCRLHGKRIHFMVIGERNGSS